MKKASDVSKEDLRELLNKNWLTHDAMWFLHCMEAFGIKKTNELNQKAVEFMASFEINRIKNLLEVDRIEDFDQFKLFITESFSLIKPEFMKFELSFPAQKRVRWKTDECFAYQGMRRLGVESEYVCGIFVRVESWLKGLGISFTAEPEIEGCPMCSNHFCERTYTLEM